MKLSRVTPMARRTAPTRSPRSFQKLWPSALANRRSLPGHHHRGGHEEEEREGQQELPRDGEDLVDADAHEAPADPGYEEEHEHRLEEEPQRASQAGPGPPQAPRKRSAPRNDVPITCAYSPSWIRANFIPEYSTRNPAISSDSASRMSKGTRFSAARVVTT